jgi:hypothetical protein
MVKTRCNWRYDVKYYVSNTMTQAPSLLAHTINPLENMYILIKSEEPIIPKLQTSLRS